MTRTLAPLAVLLALAGPVAAQTAMSAAEFESFVTGRTMSYSFQGMPFGVEEYREDRQVRWSFLGESCRFGHWYPSGTQICFEYESGSEPQCWTFFRDGAGLRARFENDPDGRDLYGARSTEEPLVCLGPEVGV